MKTLKKGKGNVRATDKDTIADLRYQVSEYKIMVKKMRALLRKVYVASDSVTQAMYEIDTVCIDVENAMDDAS